MWRTIILFALCLAIGAFLLEWVQYQFLARRFGLEILVVIVALVFAGLGGWLGIYLTRRPAAAPFEPNQKAIRSLGITLREMDVLKALCAGGSNKQIAQSLGLSPNTVKSHIASLYSKLEVSTRVSAIEKARLLSLIPVAPS